MQIRLKMRFSWRLRSLTIFHERRSILPDSATPLTPPAPLFPFPKSTNFYCLSYFWRLPTSTIAAISRKLFEEKLAISADRLETESPIWGCLMDERYKVPCGATKSVVLHAEHHRYAQRLGRNCFQ